jgi:hypothetical protein
MMRNYDYLSRDRIGDVSLTGGISGAVAGALIAVGCARESPFAIHVWNTANLLLNLVSFRACQGWWLQNLLD